MSNPSDKAALRAMLAQAYTEKVQEDPEAVTLYAPKAPVTHRPWQPKPAEGISLYEEEIARLQAEKNAPPKPEQAFDAEPKSLSIEDFPGLLEARRHRRR